MFAALNTMYCAISVRSHEIATLRAIGFGSSAIVVSITIEALVLAVVGASVGAAIAYGLVDGEAISTLGGSRWDSQLVYSLQITPELVAMATAAACVIGMIGGLLPAWRAARMSVVDSLR